MICTLSYKLLISGNYNSHKYLYIPLGLIYFTFKTLKEFKSTIKVFAWSMSAEFVTIMFRNIRERKKKFSPLASRIIFWMQKAFLYNCQMMSQLKPDYIQVDGKPANCSAM